MPHRLFLCVLGWLVVTDVGHPEAVSDRLGCGNARVDHPSLGRAAVEIVVVFPVRTCRGVRAGEAEILIRRGGRWRRLAILPYGRGANQNAGAFGRRYYRFASDTAPPADMWIEDGSLVVMRGREMLIRRTLSR